MSLLSSGRDWREPDAVQEANDTTSPGGRLVFHAFAALAEFERDLIRERSKLELQTSGYSGRTTGWTNFREQRRP